MKKENEKINKNNKQKSKNPKSKNPVVLTLYGLSILLGVYTIFTMYNSFTYIASLVSQGLVIMDELQSVIVYCVDASLPALFYTITIWAIGYMINKLNSMTNQTKISNTDIKEQA